MTKVKSKLEILQETIDYYVIPGNRAIDTSDPMDQNPDCKYWTSDGRMCAVGRCVHDPESLEIGYPGASVEDAIDCDWDLFKPEYKFEDMGFWVFLQSLHDRGRYWGDGYLTAPGIEYIKLSLLNSSWNQGPFFGLKDLKIPTIDNPAVV